MKLAEKVKKYIKNSPDLKMKKMVEFSPGVVCVHDNYDEWDVYFDKALYKPKHPRIWGEDCEGLFPPGLDGTGLGVLPSLARAPRVYGFDDAFEFAKSQLEGDDWYELPKKVG